MNPCGWTPLHDGWHVAILNIIPYKASMTTITRRTEKEGADGMMVAAVRPYLMDLGSTNGTFLNGERLDDKRFYELLEQDMIRTGNSSREYVLLHDKSGGR